MHNSPQEQNQNMKATLLVYLDNITFINERPRNKISHFLTSTIMLLFKSTSLHSNLTTHHFNLSSSSSSSKLSSSFSLLFLRHHHVHPTRQKHSSKSGNRLSVRAYMENQNSISGFANKVIGSLPVVGLIARILSDEGGVGSDIIDFAEFRRRVGKKCSINDSRAFYDFQERRGRAGDPLYVLLCCWLAAIGAGLLKTEEILEGVARLRISNDIEFEEQNFIALMNEARERRAKLKAAPPAIPMEIRVEKALDAIYVCCFGKDLVEEEDETLLVTMLSAVFPSVQQQEIKQMVRDKAVKVAEGGGDDYVPEAKPLSKEAVELQMKDLQFLKQNSET